MPTCESGPQNLAKSRLVYEANLTHLTSPGEGYIHFGPPTSPKFRQWVRMFEDQGVIPVATPVASTLEAKTIQEAVIIPVPSVIDF